MISVDTESSLPARAGVAALQRGFDERRIAARDGSTLRVYEAGERDAPIAILVNAYGMPAEFMRPLAVELAAAGVRAVTWESRGVPNVEDEFSADRCSVTQHARDLEDVLASCERPSASVLGWCSGAQVSLRFASLCPERLERLVLMNGAYSLWKEGRLSEFQRKMNELLPMCTRSADSAALACKLLSRANGALAAHAVRPDAGSGDITAFDRASAMAASVFSDGDRLHRYAHMQSAFLDEPEDAWTGGVRAQTLVLVGSANPMSPLDNSRAVARRLPRSTLTVVHGGDHYMHYLRADARRPIVEFLAEGP